MLGTRLLLAALLTTFCALDARGEITFAIGEPAEGAVKSGVGLISGWAVSDVGIVSVEAFIDGESLGPVPYGSQRGDVAAAFPDIPGALHSGCGMKWAYPLHGDGEHVLTVVVTEEGGGSAGCRLGVHAGPALPADARGRGQGDRAHLRSDAAALQHHRAEGRALGRGGRIFDAVRRSGGARHLDDPS